MNILDENIMESQRHFLRRWRIPIRQIGENIAERGYRTMKFFLSCINCRVPRFLHVTWGFIGVRCVIDSIV